MGLWMVQVNRNMEWYEVWDWNIGIVRIIQVNGIMDGTEKQDVE